MNAMNNVKQVETKGIAKKTWRTPVLNQLGNFSSLVLVGGGKLSPPAVDPGEPKKTRPSG
jgi:hypothetical protein